MKVYRIDRTTVKGNHFGLAREEKWTVNVDADFQTLDEAESYVVKMNKAHHAVDLNLQGLNPDEIKHRCLYDEKWFHKKTYFLDQPPLEKIRSLLMDDGVHIRPQEHKFNKKV